MGNYLAANNNVYAGKLVLTPGIYNEKPFKVSDYLWKEDELYGFWRLLHMMEAPHTQLSELKEIQRVSKKNSFITVDAYENEEQKKRMMDWNLTAKTIFSTSDWKLFFKANGYRGDFFWFIP
jgi:hypothetical protein